uniref:Uncharacterized protein n=1 Tax=Romanomermis culicivorax TaxID=13658 RepID=A0A915IUG0_ROMCU
MTIHTTDGNFDELGDEKEEQKSIVPQGMLRLLKQLTLTRKMVHLLKVFLNGAGAVSTLANVGILALFRNEKSQDFCRRQSTTALLNWALPQFDHENDQKRLNLNSLCF